MNLTYSVLWLHLLLKWHDYTSIIKKNELIDRCGYKCIMCILSMYEHYVCIFEYMARIGIVCE